MIYLIPIVAKLFTRTNICTVKTVLKHHYKNRPASFSIIDGQGKKSSETFYSDSLADIILIQQNFRSHTRSVCSP